MRTLSGFPDDFYPLAIVVGDRREEHAKTQGDLLAYSASPLDLMYLSSLGLDKTVTIVSDKAFVLLKPEAAVVVILQGPGTDALLVLGMARALARTVVLLVHTDATVPSMFEACTTRWHERTFEQALPKALSVLRKQARAGVSRPPSQRPRQTRAASAAGRRLERKSQANSK